MRKNVNSVHIEGYVYQHDLVKKTVQNQTSENYGKEFISGNVEIAVDEEGTNAIKVHFSYVVPTTKKGSRNATYFELMKIMEGATWVTHGKDAALKVKVDTAISLNDFYVDDNTLVSAKINEGGFVTVVDMLCPVERRSTFQADMLVTGAQLVEKENADDVFLLKGAVFNFKNDLLPVEFIVRSPEGIKYFDRLEPSSQDPKYMKVFGVINNKAIQVPVKEGGEWGTGVVNYKEVRDKSYVVVGNNPPYDFGEENVMTVEELRTAIQNREIHLADVKKRREEYKAQQAQQAATVGFGGVVAGSAPTTSVVANDNFVF